jgi:hypothetical protein
MVTVIWDSWLKAGSEEEELRLTRQVWSDMRRFDGYVSHQLFVAGSARPTQNRRGLKNAE